MLSLRSLGIVPLFFLLLGVSAQLVDVDDSSETCDASTPPLGTYSNFFQPCKLTFYTVGRSDSHRKYTCGSEYEDMSIGTQEVTVMEWPDKCVGFLERCYSVELHRKDLNTTVLDSLQFPNGTTHVGISCTADHDDAVKLGDDLAKGAKTFVTAVVILWWSIVLGCSAMVFMCLYCCLRPIFKEFGSEQTAKRNYAYGQPTSLDAGAARPCGDKSELEHFEIA